MKKVLLVLAIAGFFAACGSKGTESATTTPTENTPTEEVTATPTTTPTATPTDVAK
ncbi:MAG: hypothetical protein SPK52_02800 [Synergistales bacterium]|nr:hypothetical protein [Bacteroidales bacterium]MDY6435123.1 hypothetical protein [Synergistales bacterium]MBQ6754042.1 hypothetical protein [Bacteroidales bacterium]MDY6381184.1 hypothetical protein [Bacteroidales bacterium]MDY6393954.1 hypothetical protein [Bacteroidales bacterium]